MSNMSLVSAVAAAAALPAAFEGRAVALMLSGTKTGDRKMSALSQADSIGVLAISHGSGAVAKEARVMVADEQRNTIAESIGTGNYHAFATAYAARTGEPVKFGLKDTEGRVVRKASDDFRAFGSVIAQKLLVLEDKGKVYNSKGGYTSAAGDLMYLLQLHGAAVEIMDRLAAKDAARRAQLAAERQAEEVAQIANGEATG